MKFESILSLYLEDTYKKEKKQSHQAFLLYGNKLVYSEHNEYDRYILRGERMSSLHAEMNCVRRLCWLKGKKGQKT